MASTYSDLKIELIGTGEQSGTWGTTTNTNLGTALEEAIVGRANANFPTNADLTITLTNTNATQVARHYILNVTSGVSLTTTRNLIVPTIDKPYIVENNTTGSQSIIVKTAAGTGVTVPNGKTVMVYANGTNVVSGISHIPAVSLTTDLAIADGGTGASDAAGARTNLGLGTIATQNANNVNITGGSISGVAIGGTITGTITGGTISGSSISGGTMSGTAITGGSISGLTTDLPIADGGTGASDAASARVNLGLGTISTQNANNVSITGGTINAVAVTSIGTNATGTRYISTAAPSGGVNGDIWYQY